MDMTLNMIDEVLSESIYNTKDFKEYCMELDQLEMIMNSSLYTEAVEPAKQKMRDRASTTFKNTKDSIKAVGTVYGNTTDAGGSILNVAWRAIVSALNIVSRILKWASKHISNVGMLVVKAIDGLVELPSNIKNKIKGNIKLYITADDIKNLFAKTSSTGDYSIVYRLNLIIRYMDKLSQGELWTTHFSSKKTISDFFKQFNDDFINKDTKYRTDIDLIKRINDQYKYIKGIKFNQSVIEMNDPKVVDIYFNSTPSIKFVDGHGKERTETYLGALKVLLDFIENNKTTIENLNKSLENKLEITKDNDEFMKMSKKYQQMVSEFFQTMAKVSEIVGNIIRYIMTDIKVIEKENNQIKAATTMEKKDNEGKENKETDESKEGKENKINEWEKNRPYLDFNLSNESDEDKKICEAFYNYLKSFKRDDPDNPGKKISKLTYIERIIGAYVEGIRIEDDKIVLYNKNPETKELEETSYKKDHIIDTLKKHKYLK